MSNVEHYDLEARLATRFGEMDAAELRTALIKYVVNASVGTVQNLARSFDVPIHSSDSQQ